MLDIDIKQSLETRTSTRFVERMGDKFRAIKRMMVYIAAKELFDNVQGMLPSRPEFDELRNGLSLAEVGSDPEEPWFSVYLPSKSQKIRRIDGQKTLIFVRAKRTRPNRPSERVKFLEDNGPWTVDTIPFWPSKREAIIVQRKVSVREVSHIAKKQKQDAKKQQADLRRLGIKPTKTDQVSSRGKRNRRAISDASMAAIQLEFGGGVRPPVPAWRVSIGNVARTKFDKISGKYPSFNKLMMDPGSAAVAKWPKVDKKIRVDVAAQFVPFMKKLGIL